MIKSHSRGHEIYFHNEEWFYSNGEIYDDSRPCNKCNLYPTKEGHDACLGKLENVVSACCGHGVEEGYIKHIK